MTEQIYLPALVVGLVEAAKRAFNLPTQFCPLLSVVLGVAVSFVEKGGFLSWPETLLAGLLYGLVSAGLYDNLKKPVSFAVKKVKAVVEKVA